MARKSTKRPEQISVFISYVSEDRELAASVEAELLQLFAVGASLSPVRVFRDVGSISKGADYRAVIRNELNSADILLVLLTDRYKPSFAFAGYEVGWFDKSLEERPKIYGNVPRRIVPLCIGADSPTTLDNLEAIEIDKSKIFKVPDVAVNGGNVDLPGGITNPVFALLAYISETADKVLGKHGGAAGGVSKQDEQWRQRLTLSATRLYSSIRTYLESRVSSDTYPERKIVIHADVPPVAGANGVDLSKCKIELVGNSFQVFGFKEGNSRLFDWDDFIKKMPSQMSGTWSEGIRALITNSLEGSNENYHVVTASKSDSAYRLFVSRVVTYVSKKTEIDIFIVKMVLRQYGDPLTSRLLGAINIGLQFRFMFLEANSEFRPSKFDIPMSVDPSKEMESWKSTIRELLAHLNLILRDAQDRHLMDTDLMEKIWGQGCGPRVHEMMDAWEKARIKLYVAAQEVLSASASEFPETQEPFRKALRELHGTTDAMNREYTVRALQAVASEIGPALGQVPAVAPVAMANELRSATRSGPAALA